MVEGELQERQPAYLNDELLGYIDPIRPAASTQCGHGVLQAVPGRERRARRPA